MTVDIVESINQRKSIRAFKPDPISLATLKELMELALRAPSWANVQPWDFVIATGSKLDQIKQGFAERAGGEPGHDITRPQEFPEPYNSRRRPPGPPPASPAAPATPQSPPRRISPNTRLWGAPCVIYLCTQRSYYFQTKGVNGWAIYDLGLISENIMLLAPKYGLGTCALAQAVVYPDVLRRILEIPDSLLIVLGIAIGYPDWSDPVTQRKSIRAPLDQVVRWVGFD